MDAVARPAPPQGAVPVVAIDLAGMGYGDVEVLGPLRLALHDGETLAIAGPSGIGKTTLLRILAGLETRYRGSVTVPASRALVFQEPTLLPWRTAVRNLTVMTGIDAAAARQMLEAVGLGGLGGRYPGQLSLGQQRRLALARAFAARPGLLLMDEPFVSLDPALTEEMMALFARLRRGVTFPAVIVTHSAREAEALATRIVRLDGRPARIVEDVPNAPTAQEPGW